MQQRVDGVRQHVEELEVRAQRLGSPCAGPHRPEREVALDVVQGPEAREQLERAPRRRLEQQLVAGAHAQALLRGQREDPLGRFGGLGEGLLDVDVAAGLEGLARQRLVRRGRRADVHHVDLLRGQQRVERVVGRDAGAALEERLARLRVGLRERDDAGADLRTADRARVVPRHLAGTGDRHAELRSIGNGDGDAGGARSGGHVPTIGRSPRATDLHLEPAAPMQPREWLSTWMPSAIGAARPRPLSARRATRHCSSTGGGGGVVWGGGGGGGGGDPPPVSISGRPR